MADLSLHGNSFCLHIRFSVPPAPLSEDWRDRHGRRAVEGISHEIHLVAHSEERFSIRCEIRIRITIRNLNAFNGFERLGTLFSIDVPAV